MATRLTRLATHPITLTARSTGGGVRRNFPDPGVQLPAGYSMQFSRIFPPPGTYLVRSTLIGSGANRMRLYMHDGGTYFYTEETSGTQGVLHVSGQFVVLTANQSFGVQATTPESCEWILAIQPI